MLLSVFTLAWWAILFPMVSVPAGIAVAAGWFYGWPAGIGVAGGTVAGMVLWRQRSPQTFERWFTGRIRSRFLTWHRYRRRWATLLTACDLSTRDGDRVLVPRLVSVHIGESTDLVRARMLPGHSPDSWTNRRDHLAHGFGAQQAQIRFAGPGLVEIVFRRSDSLADPVVVPFESLAGFKPLPGSKAA
jgi:S-DNA-T family DNA segregation ATPase FtsK/SpoIIIE